MKRFFWPLFLPVLWLVLLAAPWTHNWTRNHIRDANFPFGTASAPELGVETYGNLKVTSAWKNSHPLVAEDKFVLFLAASENTESVNQNLKILTERFPNDPVILSARLMREVGAANMTTRAPGPASAGNDWSVKAPPWQAPPQNSPSIPSASSPGAPVPPPPPASGMPSAVTPLAEISMRKAQWDKIATLARHGEKLEPNNAFWWWIELTALLGGRHDAQVPALLRLGAQKSNYDDHCYYIALYQLYAHKKLDGYYLPLTAYGVNNAVLMPHFSKFREDARQVSENAYGYRLQDKPQLALQTLLDLMRMARAMRRGSKTLIGMFVGSAIESIACTGGQYDKGRIVIRATTSLAVYAQNPRSLLKFARSLNDQKAAQEISTNWVEKNKWSQIDKLFFANISYFPDVSPASVALSGGSHVLSQFLLGTLPSAILLLTLAYAIGGLPIFRKNEQRSAPVLPKWFVAALWAMGITLFLLAAQLYVAWRQLMDGFDLGIVYPGWISIAVNQTPVMDNTPIWMCVFPLVALFLIALAGATRSQKLRKSLISQIKNLLNEPEHGLTRFDFSPLLHLIVGLTVYSLLIASLGFMIGVPEKTFDIDTAELGYYSPIMMWVWSALVGLALIFKLLRGQNRRAAFAFWFRAAQLYAFVWLVFASLGFALSAIVGIPSTQSFEAQTEKRLQVGEVMPYRKKLGL